MTETTPPAVARGWWSKLDPETRRPTMAVAAIIAVLVLGTQVVNDAIPTPAGADQATGATVEVGPGVQITRLSGWVVKAHKDAPGIRLQKGGVFIDLYPETFAGDSVALANAYLTDVLEPDATDVSASGVEVVDIRAGPAARFTYVGIFTGASGTIEGEVTALPGSPAVIVDAWGAEGALGDLLGEVRAMLETIAVTA
jgi:hypothetical protein